MCIRDSLKSTENKERTLFYFKEFATLTQSQIQNCSYAFFGFTNQSKSELCLEETIIISSTSLIQIQKNLFLSSVIKSYDSMSRDLREFTHDCLDVKLAPFSNPYLEFLLDCLEKSQDIYSKIVFSPVEGGVDMQDVAMDLQDFTVSCVANKLNKVLDRTKSEKCIPTLKTQFAQISMRFGASEEELLEAVENIHISFLQYCSVYLEYASFKDLLVPTNSTNKTLS
eukprot:TRINITY_DN22606_c0_g2_i1.p1 TRINITY_DN22606_c0_g2~~TRINITY_DN22606_c0_g2_i1.p1  ORF type:complete len:245 (-),score=38.24 TRINITY_DN22606_c0_g2_i1:140-817(-)